MVLGLCAEHKNEGLLTLPNHDTNKDISSTAHGTTISTHVSMRKQKLNVQIEMEVKLFALHK